MLYPFLLSVGLLTPQARPVVSVPAPQFTRPSLTAGRSRTPLPSRAAPVRVRYVPVSTSPVRVRYTPIPALPRVRYTPVPAPVRVQVSLSSAEAEIVRRINADRETRGLSTLTVDPELVLTARGHCLDMRDRGYFDHDSPARGQHTPLDRYRYTLAQMGGGLPLSLTVGENIYYCSESNATYNVAYAHRALMNSPGHRANILEPSFTKVGVGVLQDEGGEVWVTEMFLRDSP